MMNMEFKLLEETKNIIRAKISKYICIYNKKKNIFICSCPASIYNKPCKHIKKFKEELFNDKRINS